jgi:hypothetical protein
MRRVLFAALALGLLPTLPAFAQTPRVSLVVALGPDNLPLHARRARVQVRDLLTDKRWSDALEQLFPIRLSFRLEIWRSRDGWIDEFQRAAEWSTVIQREPLQDQYRVTRLLLSGPEEFRFDTRDKLEQWLRYTTEVDALPGGTGSFYYTVTLTITALSNEDMEALERFLAGQPAAPAQPENNSIGKRVRQFLLRIAGLPWEELEVRSEKFRVAR